MQFRKSTIPWEHKIRTIRGLYLKLQIHFGNLAIQPSLSLFISAINSATIFQIHALVAGRSTLELRLKSSARVDCVKIPSMVSAAGRTQNKRHNNKVCNSSYVIYALFQFLCATRSSLIFEVKMSNWGTRSGSLMFPRHN